MAAAAQREIGCFKVKRAALAAAARGRAGLDSAQSCKRRYKAQPAARGQAQSLAGKAAKRPDPALLFQCHTLRRHAHADYRHVGPHAPQ